LSVENLIKKQQIVDVLLNSPKFLIGVEWLSVKNIEVDSSFDAIQVFKVNSLKYSGYMAIVSKK